MCTGWTKNGHVDDNQQFLWKVAHLELPQEVQCLLGLVLSMYENHLRSQDRMVSRKQKWSVDSVGVLLIGLSMTTDRPIAIGLSLIRPMTVVSSANIRSLIAENSEVQSFVYRGEKKLEKNILWWRMSGMVVWRSNWSPQTGSTGGWGGAGGSEVPLWLNHLATYLPHT